MHIIGWSHPVALFGAMTLLVSSLSYAWRMPRLNTRCLATAVPCRQQAAQSPSWSPNGGATAATMGGGR